ncbi:hypothetical protein PVAND_007826 [Polypedilum vanderplanki]|uniref:Uncharacterized protein n=1 Tax=Polypedilum vanderplanki TaxID=319348 RepID=A0A9J6C836_POLVA|nr:hypothetical protein PVAND_007826 [Polypedilum vanderplanki]
MSEDREIVMEIMEEVLNEVFAQISDRIFTKKAVHLYKNLTDAALAEILYNWNMPKPCTNFSQVIDAWKCDEAAKPVPRDSLNTPKLWQGDI